MSVSKGDVVLEFKIRSYDESVGYKIPMLRIKFDTNADALKAAEITREILPDFKKDERREDWIVFFDEDLMVLKDRLCLNFEEGIVADSMYSRFVGLMIAKFEEDELLYTQVQLGESSPNDLNDWHIKDITKSSKRIKGVKRHYH